jgi:hypothetical protein
MKTCGECGLFCSCGAMWPSGLCLPGGDRLVEAGAAACVCWERDWRGVDQSDGIEPQTAGAGNLRMAPPPPRTAQKDCDSNQEPAGLHFRQPLLF